jgi:hypothetical protein
VRVNRSVIITALNPPENCEKFTSRYPFFHFHISSPWQPIFYTSRYFYALSIRGHIVFGQSVCPYAKTLTLAISLEWQVIGLSYFICVFFMTRPFYRYRILWPCDLDLEVWPTFQKL